jgi:hypothetical protein
LEVGWKIAKKCKWLAIGSGFNWPVVDMMRASFIGRDYEDQAIDGDCCQRRGAGGL